MTRFRPHCRYIGEVKSVEPMSPEISAVCDRTHTTVSALVFIIFVVGFACFALGLLPTPQ